MQYPGLNAGASQSLYPSSMTGHVEAPMPFILERSVEAPAPKPVRPELVEGREVQQVQSFHVYILRCSDGSFYTGHTDNLQERLQLHLAAPAGAYTSTRLPVTLAWTREFSTRAEAIEAERQIKGWSRAKKDSSHPGRLGGGRPSCSQSWSGARESGFKVFCPTPSFDKLRTNGSWAIRPNDLASSNA